MKILNDGARPLTITLGNSTNVKKIFLIPTIEVEISKDDEEGVKLSPIFQHYTASGDLKVTETPKVKVKAE